MVVDSLSSGDTLGDFDRIEAVLAFLKGAPQMMGTLHT